MYVKIKLIENQEDDLASGSSDIETYSKEFVEELKKYKCPFRLAMFLTKEENKSYTSLDKPLDDDKYKLIIDLSETTTKIIDEKISKGELYNMTSSAYIERTSNLDKYGNQVI